MRANEFSQPRAAGCIIVAEDTGRWCLQQRSDHVSDPGVWSTWGGGVEPGETLEETVQRELAEEGGYTGNLTLQSLHKTPRYATYIAYVPVEFEPKINHESKDWCWVEHGQWPEPMHPGLKEALSKLKKPVKEGFDQPYPFKWEKSDYGDYDALAILGDGTYLSIMFEHTTPYEVNVSFWRNNSLEVTGEGDAQRIFATVLAAIQEFLKMEQPANISFSASKEVEPGQNSLSRAKLYNRLVQRYASAWGYTARSFDQGNEVTYELTRTKSIEENFNDGKNPGRKGLAKRMGVNCKQSVSKLRSIAKNSSGERQRMAHWCANMKSGRNK